MTAHTGTRPRAQLRAAVPLAVAVALSAVLNTWALAQNGYANIYYAAGVKSMLGSFRHFLFLAADPGGLVSLDKPPLGIWLQALSAELFGFSPLPLLLPEALAGVAAVAALYLTVRQRFGTVAATISALTLATFPALVAVARDNNPDMLLILLLTLACGAALRACESGRLRALFGSALLVALAFNTKALAAYLAVPGIVLAYLWCAPGTLRRRTGHLLLAGLVCAAVSFAWILVVELTPAGQRPFVGSSSDNTELGLTFGYNGFGRATGQKGGPGASIDREVLPAATAVRSPGVRPPTQVLRAPSLVSLPDGSPDAQPKLKETIFAGPIAFGDAPGPLRLFGKGFGDQGAWLLALALFGLIALALTRPSRRDPRLAALIVFGGFLLCEAIFLSFSKGIVHPYYLSALAPGTAAMAGPGLLEMVRAGRNRAILLTFACLSCAAVQIVLLHRAHYLLPWQLALAPLVCLCLLVTLRVRPRERAGALALFALLALAPTAYAASTWREPVQGTFPAAGPRAVPGNGGAGLSSAQLETDDALITYLLSHGASGRFQLLTEASLTADTPILLGLHAAALGGYGGVDPALDGPGLGRLVAAQEARFVLLGGSYAYLGGNAASTAAARLCPQVPFSAWRGPGVQNIEGFHLLDCAGEAPELERTGG